MASKRSLIPTPIRKLMPKGLSEDEALVFWAAYQQGTEHQLDGALQELDRKLELLQEQCILRAPVSLPALPPGLPGPGVVSEPQAPPRQAGSLPGGVIDLAALRAEAEAGLPAEGDGLQVTEGIGPWSPESLTQAMQTVKMLAKPSRLPAAKRKILDWFRKHADTYPGADKLPTGYDRLLKYELEAHGLLRQGNEEAWEEEIEENA